MILQCKCWNRGSYLHKRNTTLTALANSWAALSLEKKEIFTKLAKTWNFSKNLRANLYHRHACIPSYLKHQHQSFSVLLQKLDSQQSNSSMLSRETTMSIMLMPKQQTADQWVYWPFLSISLRWLWLQIHPCNTLQSQHKGACSRPKWLPWTQCLRWNPAFQDAIEPAQNKIPGNELHSSTRVRITPAATNYNTAFVSDVKYGHGPLEASKIYTNSSILPFSSWLHYHRIIAFKKPSTSYQWKATKTNRWSLFSELLGSRLC